MTWFALHLLKKFGGGARFGEHTIEAGDALVKLIGLLGARRSNPTAEDMDQMFESYGRLPKSCKRAGIAQSPKHHLAAHLFHRIGWHHIQDAIWGTVVGPGRKPHKCLADEVRPPALPTFSTCTLRCILTLGPHRVPFFGLPHLYSCYQDKSLNSNLRDLAQYCHRATFPWRAHVLFDFSGRLGNESIACQGGSLPLVAWPRPRR